MEDEENGFLLLQARLLFHIGLVLGEEFWVETNVSGLVNTVHVTETSGDGEILGPHISILINVGLLKQLTGLMAERVL